MNRRTWGAACALALVGAVLPAVTAAAAPPGDHAAVAVRGTLVRTLGSGRDAVGRPVETSGVGVRTRAGEVLRLEPDASARALTGVHVGDTVEAVVEAPAGTGVAALRSSRTDAPAPGLGRAGELRARSVDVLAGAPVAAAPRAGVHSVYVVSIDDVTATGEHSLAEGRAAVARGADYWRTETGGIVAGMTVRGEATLATDDVCSELAAGGYFDVWDRAQRLFPGVDAARSARTHLVVMVPRSCGTDEHVGWTGLATIGTGLTSGGLVLLVDDDAHTVAHELGHNFGLGHSNLEIGAGAVPEEYLGLHSVMGAAFADGVTPYAPPALDPAFREVLGILPTSSVTAGLPGVDTRLRAVASTGSLTLRFSEPGGRIVHAELRDGSGRDAGTFFASPGARGDRLDVGTGVRLSTVYADSLGTPTLLTLGSAIDGVDRATLRAGEQVRLRGTGRTVSVRSLSRGAAVVAFSATSSPTVSLAPVSVRYGRTTKVSATVTGASTPQGVVRFYVGSTRVASARVASGGRATATLPDDVRPGRHVLTARYDGDVMLAVARARRTVTVAKGRPTMTVTKASKVRAGARATLTVRVGTVAGTRPSGTVRAKVGSRDVSPATKVVRSGRAWVAKVRTTALPRGKVVLVYTPSRSASRLLTTTTAASGRTAR